MNEMGRGAICCYTCTGTYILLRSNNNGGSVNYFAEMELGGNCM